GEVRRNDKLIAPGIILAALVGLAAILGVGLLIPQATDITSGIVGQVMAPLTLMVERSFTVLGYLAPLLIAVVPLYLVLNSKSLGKDKRQMVVFGAVYGLALYGIAIFTGLDTLLMQEMRSSWMVGSTLGMAVTTLGAAAEWVLGLFAGLLLWGAGFVLAVVDGLLSALIGIGEAAGYSRRGVARAKKGILDRLGR
ncbi:MAG: hypothetical protein ABIJ47_08255, partial [Candidatus Bathyarchaeota archaeon]